MSSISRSNVFIACASDLGLAHESHQTHNPPHSDAAVVGPTFLCADASVVAPRPFADEALSKELRWGLQREYRLTYSNELRDSEELVDGSWWGPDDVNAEDAS